MCSSDDQIATLEDNTINNYINQSMVTKGCTFKHLNVKRFKDWTLKRQKIKNGKNG